MIDAHRLLGTLIGTGLGGISRHAGFHLVQPDLRQNAAPPGGLLGLLDSLAGGSMGRGAHGGLGRGPALALLAKLALESLRDRDRATGQRLAESDVRGYGDASPGGSADKGPEYGYAGGIGEPDPDIDENHARLLIEAMIAALSVAHGISPADRQQMLRRLEEAGSGNEERAYVSGLFDRPPSQEDIVRRVDGLDTAARVYAASLVALNGDNEAERAYLANLAARLNLPEDTVADMHRDLDTPQA